MSSSAEQNSSHSPHVVGSDLSPLQGGRWREVKFDDLKRSSVSSETVVSSDTAEDRPESESQVESVLASSTSASSTSAPSTSAPSPSARPAPRKVVRLERRQELEHHLKGSPTDLDAFLELGRIYRAENRPADARRIFKQAIQVFPEEKDLLWEHEEATLARSLQQLREVSDIAKRLNTAETDRELKRCQDDWACRRMEICRARLKRDPSMIQLHVVLAEAMYDAGFYEGAIEELQPVFEHEEFSPMAHLINGRCLLEVGKDVDAMAALRAASLRRSVPSPPRIRVIALRLLCETADRLGVSLTLAQYRQHLRQAEQELAALASADRTAATQTPATPAPADDGSTD